MKKFLSLVMALVMVMSLTVVGASAKDFTDSDTITYDEAIDVISALEIVDGYTDGSFQPTTQLNRGQAAKIICNLILGVAAADNLSASVAPFPDVPASHHFAGYIAYCANEGIISGYSDGKFRPGETLSGYAFMKMLLGALGYDQNNEGLTGPNWTVQVAKLVQGVGLAADLVDDFVGSKAVTRQEACLYALNTLQARTVEYKTPGSSVVVNGVEITQKASNASYRTYDTILGGSTTNNVDKNINADGYIQFAEEHFPRLVLNKDKTDNFGRPQHMWTYKGDKIGSYTDAADASYEGTVTMADIYDDLSLTSTTDDFILYIDGMYAKNFYPLGKETNPDYYDEGPAYLVANGGKMGSTYKEDGKTVDEADIILTIKEGTIADNMLIGTGPGSTIECYKTGTQDGLGTIVVVNTYIGEVVSVNAAEGKHAANVEVAPVGDDVTDVVEHKATMAGELFLSGTNGFENTFETTSFEVGDIVTFNYAFNKDGDEASVKKLAKAESVEGEVKDYTDMESFTLGGTEYKYSKMATQKVDSNDIGTSVIAYLDKQGNVLYYTEGADNNKNYALVLDAGYANKVGANSFAAELLFADGTTKLVTTDKQYGATGANDETEVHPLDPDNCLIGEWVTVREDSRGRTVLTKPSVDDERTWTNMLFDDHKGETESDNATKYTVKNTDNIGSTSSESASRLKIGANNARLNSSTVIIVKTKADTFKVFNGVKNMPIITDLDRDENPDNNKIYYSVMTRYNQTYARFVYIDATEAYIVNRTNSDLFLVANDSAKRSDDGTDKYYSFKGVVDGEIMTSIKLTWSDLATRDVIGQLLGGKGNEILLSTYSVTNGKYEVNLDDAVKDDTGEEFTDGRIDRVTSEAITITGSTNGNEGSFALADGCKFFRVDGNDVNSRVIASTWHGIGTGVIGTKYAYVGLSLNRDYEVTAVYWRVK